MTVILGAVFLAGVLPISDKVFRVKRSGDAEGEKTQLAWEECCALEHSAFMKAGCP